MDDSPYDQRTITLSLSIRELQTLNAALGLFGWDGRHRLYDVYEQSCTALESANARLGNATDLPSGYTIHP